MATRGSIPKMMATRRDRHAPARGGHADGAARASRGGTRGEIVVGERLGVLVEERHPTGGIDPVRIEAHLAAGPMVGRGSAPGSGHRSSPRRRSTRVSNRSCTTTRSTAHLYCPASWASRRSSKSPALALPGWSVVDVEADRLPGTVQVLPQRTAHARGRGVAATRRRRRGRRVPRSSARVNSRTATEPDRHGALPRDGSPVAHRAARAGVAAPAEATGER